MSDETVRPEFSKERLLAIAGFDVESAAPVPGSTPGMKPSPTEAISEARKQELLEIANRH